MTVYEKLIWFFELTKTPIFRSVALLFPIGWAIWAHYHRRVWTWLLPPAALLFFMVFDTLAEGVAKEPIDWFEMVIWLFGYSTFVYVYLCEKLMRGWAAELTTARSDRWVKEIDYLYLALGAFGAVGTVNRLEVVTNKYSLADVFGPVLLATALVLRLIKTRAELAEWNKASTWEPKSISPPSTPAS